MPDPVTIDAGPFDCLECGKRVTLLGRTESPWHVVAYPDGERVQWSFCGSACMSTYLDRWHQDHPEG